jgi:endonuclease YncB( thermonuclease family)
MPALPRTGWPWRARLRRIVDADTLELELDRGFRDYSVRRVRLAAVNAPERGTAEGRAAIEWLTEWLHARDALAAQSAELPPSRWPLVALTVRADGFGDRWDGWLWAVRDGECLNQALIASGHARPWPPGDRPEGLGGTS